MPFVRAWLLPFTAVLSVSLLLTWLGGTGLVALLTIIGAAVAVFSWRVPTSKQLAVLRLGASAIVLKTITNKSLFLYLVVVLIMLVMLPLENRYRWSGNTHDYAAMWWTSGAVVTWGLIRFYRANGAWSLVIPPAIGALVLAFSVWYLFGSSLASIGAIGYSNYIWNGWAYLWWILLVVSAVGFFHISIVTAQVEHARQQAVAQGGIQQPLGALPGRPTATAEQVSPPARRLDAQNPKLPIPAKAEVPALSLGELPDHLFGQDHAIKAWTDLLAQYLPYYQAGVVTRPLAVVMTGPAGVGKHYCVDLLKKGPLRGLDIRLIEVSESGTIAENILTAIADGGEHLKRTIFIASVNDSHGAVADVLASGEITQDRLIEALSTHVDKQALRRFTRIIPFAPLDPTACAQIAGCYLVELADRNGIVIERLDPRFLYRCARLSTASVLATGARAIQLEVPKILGDGLEQCKLHLAAIVDIGMADDDMIELRITATLV